MNSEISRSGMALNATPATSPSNTTASAGFSLSQFETELSALVNEALQAAGVSPSEASFSFNPTSSNSSTTSSGSSTASTSATSTGTGSQTNAASGNSQSNGASDTVTIPFVGTVSVAPATTSSTTATTTSTSNNSPAMPLSLTDDTNPVVGTEGLIYDPKVAEFGGMGAAPITDTNTLQNPFTGQKVSEDLVFAGYQKIYGNDTASLEGALMQQWGASAVNDYVQQNPGATVATIQQESGQTQTNFEMYGPWASFTDPSTGVLSYFDANGVQYADGTGPASQMFNALGGQNTTAWQSATAL